MPSERRDYLMAFLIGAVVGIGAAMLLSPAKKKRFVRGLPQGIKRFRKRSRRRHRLVPGR
jgi:gas vesicle protein